ncbi:MAG: type IV secretory system conjugative DNA transfer family protein [Flavonifractor plautii]
MVWAALLIAPNHWKAARAQLADLPALIASLTAALQNPLEVRWTDKSLLSILSCAGVYIMALALWGAEHGRRREGAEHGSAAWASPRQVNAMFCPEGEQDPHPPCPTRAGYPQAPPGLECAGHRRQSGSAKTRSYVKPNILEANTNYVITDPKQEVLTATGGWLKHHGI